MLLVSVRNEGIPTDAGTNPERTSPTLGLQNISERLRMLYGAQYRFDTRVDDAGSYQVDIAFPLREFASANMHSDLNS